MSPRRAALAAALVTLTGCLPAWVGPTRQDAATLAFVSEVKTGYVRPFVFANGRECRERRKIELPGLGNLYGRSPEIRIPPGEEFTALASINDGNWSCSIAATFLPKPNEAYTVLIDGTAQKCLLGVFRAEGKKLVRESTTRPRKWRQPTLSNAEAQCSD